MDRPSLTEILCGTGALSWRSLLPIHSACPGVSGKKPATAAAQPLPGAVDGTSPYHPHSTSQRDNRMYCSETLILTPCLVMWHQIRLLLHVSHLVQSPQSNSYMQGNRGALTACCIQRSLLFHTSPWLPMATFGSLMVQLLEWSLSCKLELPDCGCRT